MYVETSINEETGLKTYQVHGQIFFNSSDRFIEMFDFKEVIDNIVIDLNKAHFWDLSAVAALDKVVIKFRREGTEVEIKGLNKASQTIIDKFGVYDNPAEIDKILGGH
jgi:SulP family sulfate permease